MSSKLVQNVKKTFTYLNIHDVNRNVVNAQYAVRGRVSQRAQELQKQLDEIKSGQSSATLPFDEITECNIGNPQTFGQPPLSFFRQVLAGALYADYRNSGQITNPDVLERIEYYYSHITGNMGAYSLSPGYTFGRKSVADYIKRRDGLSEAPSIDDITLLGGASEGVSLILQSLVSHSKDGVMIPIPQYPIYSAQIALCGGSQINYFLKEEEGWSTNLQCLKKAYKNAREEGIYPKLLTVINPGNPTGSVLKRETIEQMVKFAYDHKMVIIADEVYQSNVYVDTAQFYSFRKIINEMPAPYNLTELVSLHSTSKGLTGECGIRGGYMELTNFDPQVQAQINKLKTMGLCSNTTGQLLTELMCNHPRPNAGFRDETVEEYQKERDVLFQGLKERSQIVYDTLNKMENIETQPVEGAMYAFPRIHLSAKAISAAEEMNIEPDLYYCLKVLENTGIVLVPGSGFGQVDDTYHFRTTNLIRPENKMRERMEMLNQYNSQFHREHK